MRKNRPARSSPALQKALVFARKIHKGQKRTSGASFITHVVAVADILKGIHADEETLIAALLHDSLEDTPLRAETMRKKFGATVTRLVEGVTKVERLEKTFDKQIRNMESIRKMFRSMGKDIRVIFIKIADRLHNMRTLKFVPPDKQQRIASETKDIYCPLAKLIGIRAWYEELTDLCFRVLDPGEYEVVQRKMEETKQHQWRAFEKWATSLEHFLHEHGHTQAYVKITPRHFREIRTATHDQMHLLQHVETFHHILVTIPSHEDECYAVLHSVHQFASYVPHSIDDYITYPKLNGYQALHTTLVSPHGNPVRIIIQTKRMQEQAELGMATLYQKPLKERKHAVLPGWVEELTSLEESERDLQTFFRRIQQDVFGQYSRIQVKTTDHRKKFVDVPSIASILDLAYYLGDHTGSYVKSAVVNDQLKSLKVHVHDGDRVLLHLDRTRTQRNAEDLYCIHTSLAHRSLITHLSHLPRSQQRQRGHDQLLKAINMTMDPFFSIRWQKEVHTHIDSSEEVLQRIGCGMTDAYAWVEQQSKPEDFFLLDPDCFYIPGRLPPTTHMHYVLRTSLRELRKGSVVGIQAGPDVIDVVSTKSLSNEENRPFSKELVPLVIRPDIVRYPFAFALRWTFEPDTNPLTDIAALQSQLDTPVELLRFDTTSVNLGFRTDRLRTIQIGYKYLYSLPHVIDIFRITPA